MVLKKIPNWENPSRAIAPLSRPRGRNRSRSIKLCEVGLTLEFLFLTGVETDEKIVKKEGVREIQEAQEEQKARKSSMKLMKISISIKSRSSSHLDLIFNLISDLFIFFSIFLLFFSLQLTQTNKQTQVTSLNRSQIT